MKVCVCVCVRDPRCVASNAIGSARSLATGSGRRSAHTGDEERVAILLRRKKAAKETDWLAIIKQDAGASEKCGTQNWTDFSLWSLSAAHITGALCFALLVSGRKIVGSNRLEFGRAAAGRMW